MAQLKEGSVIRKSTGDEIIATENYVDDKIDNIDTGSGSSSPVTSVNGKI